MESHVSTRHFCNENLSEWVYRPIDLQLDHGRVWFNFMIIEKVIGRRSDVTTLKRPREIEFRLGIKRAIGQFIIYFRSVTKQIYAAM